MNKIDRVAVAAFISLVSLSQSVDAQSLNLTRCNTKDGSTYVPALLIYSNGARHVFKIGDNGLTRKVMYDAAEAKAFIAQELGLPMDQLSYTDCSAGLDSPDIILAPAPPPPPGGGESGGCGSCGSGYPVL